MSDIKILIACHKKTELPDMPLYLPIQVGAEKSGIQLPMQKDNTGNNISGKNSSYCEMTAQYWAWKNLKSDYIGLFHYRRFLSFSDKHFEEDERRHVKVGVLDEYTKQKYSMEDESAARKIIEGADIVVAKEQDITKVGTPRGLQKNVYQHWKAMDGYLIRFQDVEMTLQITKEMYPDFYPWLMRYMNGRSFLGFNCFVMKSQYFNAMCKMEFDILDELERRTSTDGDLSSNAQVSRVFGYMGEILFSAYVYYLLHTADVRVKHVQMLSFEYTDPVEGIFKVQQTPSVVPIICAQTWHISDPQYCMMVYSLLTHLKKEMLPSSKDEFIDVYMIHRHMSDYYRQKLKSYAELNKNASIHFIDSMYVDLLAKDRSGTSMGQTVLKDGKEEPGDTVYESFLPWMVQVDRFVLIRGGALIAQDVSVLMDTDIKDDYCVCAHDLEKLAELMDGDDKPYKDTVRRTGMKDPYAYGAMNVILVNAAELRKKVSIREFAVWSKKCIYDGGYAEDVFNHLFAGHMTYLEQKWASLYPYSMKLENIIKLLPPFYQKENKKAMKSTGAVVYRPLHDISDTVGSDFFDLYFKIAKDAGVYEIALSDLAKWSADCMRYGKRKSLMERILLPQNSRRRILVRSLVRKIRDR